MKKFFFIFLVSALCSLNSFATSFCVGNGYNGMSTDVSVPVNEAGGSFDLWFQYPPTNVLTDQGWIWDYLYLYDNNDFHVEIRDNMGNCVFDNKYWYNNIGIAANPICYMDHMEFAFVTIPLGDYTIDFSYVGASTASGLIVEPQEVQFPTVHLHVLE